MSVGGPAHAWISVLDPDSEFDGQLLTGLSGTVVQEPEISKNDMPFLHPFGNDFEFIVAPDARYAALAAPMTTDHTYKDALRRANANGLNVKGVIGMEIDSGLVPKEYRAKMNDRVVLFGRWIVDAGHDDFHTEIHPPLIMISASPARSSRGVINDATSARIITRPYLVSQEFGDGALLEHLLIEVAKAENPLPILGSVLMRAHPRLMPMPFQGLNIVTFKLRPPRPRQDRGDKLVVSFAFTRRDDSTAIQVLRGSDQDSVRVIMVLNEAGYVPPPEPPRRNKRLSLDDITEMEPTVGNILRATVFAQLLLNPKGAVVLARGIETHTYAPLTAPNLPVPTHVDVNDLRPVNAVINARQPFPVAGTITVEWDRFRLTPPQEPVARVARRPPPKKRGGGRPRRRGRS